MGKNSFSIFETLLSITALSIIISGFLNSSYYDNKAIDNSSLLNNLENKFTINDFESFFTNSTKITIIKNYHQKEEILVKKHIFENENIKIYKYEK